MHVISVCKTKLTIKIISNDQPLCNAYIFSRLLNMHRLWRQHIKLKYINNILRLFSNWVFPFDFILFVLLSISIFKSNWSHWVYISYFHLPYVSYRIIFSFSFLLLKTFSCNIIYICVFVTRRNIFFISWRRRKKICMWM